MALTEEVKQKGPVLVVGPAISAQGGISSVIRAHRETETWTQYRCELVETYDGGTRVNKLRFAVRAYRKFLMKIRSARLIHVHLAGQNSLLRKLPIISYSRLLGKPVILHVHAYSAESLFEDTPGWAVRHAFRSAKCVIALSPAWAKQIEKNVSALPVKIVPNPATMPVRATTPRKLSHPTVLFVGKLEPRKGYADLIRAARSVLNEVPNARFVLAGHGETDKAEALATQLNISDRVSCLGWTDGHRLSRLFAEASVFCLPSYNEGVPMAVIEAMSYSLPVVTTPVGGIPDVISDGSNGVLVKPGDSHSLAKEITKLLKDPTDRRVRMGEAARNTVERLCNISTVERKLAAVYEEFCF